MVSRRERMTRAIALTTTPAVVRSESVRNIIRERRMLEHLDHPFLCNLRYSFQDIEYLYVSNPPSNLPTGARSRS